MDDLANKYYAAVPERLYIILDGKITYEVFPSKKKKPQQILLRWRREETLRYQFLSV